MKSFRTEIENPIVEQDILDLQRKIQLFRDGKIDEERFRSLRLARGVYGQRQQGVQMIRIKIPYGRLTSSKLLQIADVSDEYSTGRLHITTRQDIQIHYVSLDRTPELWAELEKEEVTLREACGNTVRNVTASELAGIDPDEHFDVTPYADALFRYFLRNPVCQEMGRKFKIAFSGSEKDDALTFMHDLGFIAQVDAHQNKGFKVVLGGGLGSQPREADIIFSFLGVDEMIPFTEAVLRIFDRHGERNRRLKARLKFLINDIGLETFLAEVNLEMKALSHNTFKIEHREANITINPIEVLSHIPIDNNFKKWIATNIIPQKQQGLFAIGIKVKLGDFYTNQARFIADLAKKYAASEIRLTLRQNIIIPHVREDLLPLFYQELKKIGLAEIGFNSTADITACPGTDTCNLGIASSTGIAVELEKVLQNEYPQYLNNKEILIKISGCMNACGQHNMAHIGFQGMTIKVGQQVAPALQVLVGGAVLGDGKGRFSDKLIKIPSKRGPDALRLILNDFESHGKSLDFISYYDLQGSNYFYEMLKPLSNTDNLIPSDFIDWGHDSNYQKAIGVGECAGVVIDLVATLLFESEEKLESGINALAQHQWADAIYHAYNVFVNVAKALLISESISCNTQANIIEAFDMNFVNTNKMKLENSFSKLVYQMRENKPSSEFAVQYVSQAQHFYKRASQLYSTSQKTPLS